jgi:hypothetical protein
MAKTYLTRVHRLAHDGRPLCTTYGKALIYSTPSQPVTCSRCLVLSKYTYETHASVAGPPRVRGVSRETLHTHAVALAGGAVVRVLCNTVPCERIVAEPSVDPSAPPSCFVCQRILQRFLPYEGKEGPHG